MANGEDKGKDEGAGSIGEALGVRCIEWIDRLGGRHSLPPPSLRDLAEMEIEHGPIGGWFSAETMSAELWATTIWTSLRKEGLSRRDMKDRKWRMDRDLAAELVGIGSDGFAAVDAFGESHRFHPLTLRDLIEIERGFGRVASWKESKSLESVKFIQRVIWCSLRKGGRRPEEIAAGSYAMDEDDSGMLFHPSVAGRDQFALLISYDLIAGASLLAAKLMAGGGVKLEEAKPESDPPSADAAPAA